MSFIEELSTVPVLIVAGTGGVGKTTMSCAIAISLAQKNDARVLVITIDPAKRLASVLCEDDLSHIPQKINHSKFLASGESSGEVFAAMADTSCGWKEIVERYTKSSDDAKRIFSNNLYLNLTTRFSHSHDFVAMDQLYEHYRSGEFDFIVLDTPPASKAFGFFDAPQAMSEFFGGRLVRLITSPYRFGSGRAAKLFDLASQPFFALADKVLGKQFLNDIGEFFFLFHTMYDDFVDRAQSITDFLRSSRVHAILITNPSQFISKSYEDMGEGLLERKIELDHLLVNNVPFTLEVKKDVEDYLQNSRKCIQGSFESSIAHLIEIDWKLSKSVYLELDNPARGFSEGHQRHMLPIVISNRVLETDEPERMSALVAGVQNLTTFDDTI